MQPSVQQCPCYMAWKTTVHTWCRHCDLCIVRKHPCEEKKDIWKDFLTLPRMSRNSGTLWRTILLYNDFQLGYHLIQYFHGYDGKKQHLKNDVRYHQTWFCPFFWRVFKRCSKNLLSLDRYRNFYIVCHIINPNTLMGLWSIGFSAFYWLGDTFVYRGCSWTIFVMSVIANEVPKCVL